MGTQLIRRNDELALLYEKIRIQQSTLNKGEIQYRERLRDIRQLKVQLDNAKRELQIQSHEVTNIEALKNEVYHVQRELLQERTKVKALSEELENPMNVHRYVRFCYYNTPFLRCLLPDPLLTRYVMCGACHRQLAKVGGQ